jgi:hypothetical protein
LKQSWVWRWVATLVLAVVLVTGLAALANHLLDFFFISIFVALALGAFTVPWLFWILLNGQPRQTRVFVSALSTLTVLSLSFSLLATIPLNIDRSFSVWTLANLDARTSPGGGSVHVGDLVQDFEEFFSPSGIQLQRRLEEQQALGNISIRGSYVELSPRGKALVRIFAAVGRTFNLHEQYFLGEVPEIRTEDTLNRVP